MDFRSATDSLFSGISHEELADALGVSIASIRQARLDPDAKAHRNPPRDWEQAVIKLASEKMQKYRRLISALQSAQQQSFL